MSIQAHTSLATAARTIRELRELEQALDTARDEAEAAIRTASELHSYREIAEAAGVSRSAVEWLVARQRPYVRRSSQAANERRRRGAAAPQEPGKSVRETAAALGVSEAWVRRLASPERDAASRLPSMKSPHTGRLRIMGPRPGETWSDI